MSDPSKENRVKILSINSTVLVDLVNWMRGTFERFHFYVPECLEIPEDAEVIAANVDWRMRRIELLLAHPSFEPVPCGSQPPMVIDTQSECRIKTVEPSATEELRKASDYINRAKIAAGCHSGEDLAEKIEAIQEENRRLNGRGAE